MIQKKMMMRIMCVCILFSFFKLSAQNVQFEVLGKKYELVREAKTWLEAAAFARDKGAHLAKINSAPEQNGVWQKLRELGARAKSNTVADGGGAYYVWLGGNDLEAEGTWIWDGDNLNGGLKFWNGTGTTGYRVGNQYSNWGRSARGKEPDNYLNNQDGVAIALTNWPIGTAGQWNDIKTSNRLYFLIEYGNDVYEYDFERLLLLRDWKQQRVGGPSHFFYKWTRQDIVEDAKHGKYYVSIMSNNANDWLVSDKIKLKKGKYCVSFWTKRNRNNNIPKVRIGVGSTQSYTSMKVIKEKNVNNTIYELVEADYIAKNDEDVYIGIHSILSGQMSELCVDYFRVRKIKNTAPIAKTNNNREVVVGEKVELTGESSSDPDGDRLTYKWEAPAGITLINANKAKASFTAPNVLTAKSYTIKLTVSDGLLSHSKSVRVTVKPVPTDKEIAYTDLNPDLSFTVREADGFGNNLGKIDFNKDGVVDFSFEWTATAFEWAIRCRPVAVDNQCILSAGKTGPVGEGYIQPLATNTSIGFGSSNWGNHTPKPLIGNHTDGNFQGLGDKYIGVRFMLGEKVYYGWVLVELTGKKLIIKEYAYNKISSGTIKAGEKGEKRNQTITFPAIANKIFGDADFTLNASSSAGLAISYTIEGPATLTGNKVHLTGAGNVKLTAKQAGNANYNAATAVVRSFTVAKAVQTITFPAIANKTFGDADFTLNASSSAGLAISYTIEGPATLTGNKVHLTGAGNVKLTAKQAGNANYNAATAVVRSFTVAKAAQTITFPAIANKTFGDADFTLNASSSAGLVISYTIEGPATLTGNRVHLTGVGRVKITAKQNGNASYNAALAVVRSFDVVRSTVKRNQTITFPVIANKTFGDTDFTLNASSSSGLEVSYTIEGPATLTGNKVHLTGAGNVKLTAKQAGNVLYNAAPPVTRSFTVAKAAQTITFPVIANKTFGDADFTLNASSSAELAISYTIEGPATITANRVHLTGAGNVKLTAKQTGNGNYNAATAVVRSFTVAKAAQTITFPAIANKTFGDADFTLNASSSAGLAISYTIEGPAILTGNKVHLTGAGNVQLTAKQAGNANYNAATDVVRAFKVKTTTGISELDDKAISLYPNPVSDIFYVKSTIHKITELHVFNTEGKKLKTKIISGKEANINISDLPSGLYFVKIFADDLLFTKRIIKL